MQPLSPLSLARIRFLIAALALTCHQVLAEPPAPAPLKLDLPATTAKPGEQQAMAGRGSIFFVGNATVLLRFGDFTLLTDPNFLHRGDHVHLGYGLKALRLTEPALAIGELPPIDLVLLSHYHGDHFDQLVEEKLDRKLPIVSTGHAVRQLRERGFKSLHALQTWQSLEVTKGASRLRVTSMPGRHGPPAASKALPPVMGTMVEFLDAAGTPAYRLYISGDTLAIDELKEIPKRFPDIDLALLHLGGTRVVGMLVTMDGEQGVRALQMIQPETVIPIHYNDYDVFKSPLEDFLAEARKAGLKTKVQVLKHGETYEFGVRKAK